MAPVIESHNNHNYFRINQVISRQFLNTLQIDQTIKSHVEPCSWSLAPKMYLTFGYLLKINQVHSGLDEAILVMANIHIFPSDAHCGDPLGVAAAHDHPSGRMSPTKWHSAKYWIDLNLFSSVVKHLRAQFSQIWTRSVQSIWSWDNHCSMAKRVGMQNQLLSVVVNSTDSIVGSWPSALGLHRSP